MLRTILISESPASAGQLRYLTDTCGIFKILKVFEAAPSSFELQRSLSLEPEVVLLELTDGGGASLADLISTRCPHALVVGVGEQFGSSPLALDSRLPRSPSPEQLFASLPQALGKRLSGHDCQLLTFMPAKAGSGSSTIALNAAACLAQKQQRRVLFVDADLRSSALTAMVGQTPRLGLESLFDQFDDMATIDLGRAKVAWHGVDLLISTRSVEASAPSPAHYMRLLSHAGGLYDSIVVDLPELVNPATLAAVRASHELFVVCTPEIPSLMLAEQRLSELERLKLPSDRVGVIVNRWQRTDPSPKSLGEMLGQPRIFTFPNDYRAVQKSFISGEPIPASKLADAFDQFTGSVVSSGLNESGIAGTLKRFFGFSQSAGRVA